jgi:hypothetical protein
MQIKKIAIASLLVCSSIFTISTAFAWTTTNIEKYSSETIYRIKCDDGVKWTLAKRNSDGWVAAREGSNSYMYKNIDSAARKVCKE